MSVRNRYSEYELRVLKELEKDGGRGHRSFTPKGNDIKRPAVVSKLIDDGLIQWLPAADWGRHRWEITAAGRRVLMEYLEELEAFYAERSVTARPDSSLVVDRREHNPRNPDQRERRNGHEQQFEVRLLQRLASE